MEADDKSTHKLVEKVSYKSYDRERYTQLLEIISHMYEHHLQTPADVLLSRFQKEVGACTPKIGVNVGVHTTSRRLLVLRRADGGSWCLPCGWVAIGESPDDAAVRETLEETGLSIRIQGTIDLLLKGPMENRFLHHQLSLLILCDRFAEHPILLSHEHVEYAWIFNPGSRAWHGLDARPAKLVLAFIDTPGSPVLQITRELAPQSYDFVLCLGIIAFYSLIVINRRDSCGARARNCLARHHISVMKAHRFRHYLLLPSDIASTHVPLRIESP